MRGTDAVLPVRGFIESELMPPQQAVIAFLARAALPGPQFEEVRLADALGRILARDICADRDYPAVPRSSMDGFAVRSADTPGTLAIAGEVLMGHLFEGRLHAGQALRIPTGGSLPEGADAVVPVEDVRVEGAELRVQEAIAPLDCVTPAGDDMKAGEHVLCAGRQVGAAVVSVLATLGVAHVPVFRKPRVGVISSGDELVAVGATAGPAQIRDSNRYAIGASLMRRGCTVVELPTVTDRPGALETALVQALGLCDAVIISGGSSVGTSDHTPAAIEAAGKPGVIVHGLRVKPGKPTVLAAVDGKPVIGLPGNPASALMILEAVIAPVIAALTGSMERPLRTSAVMEEDFSGRPGWTWFVPVFLRDDGERYFARVLPIRSSWASLAARAHGFIILDEGKTRVAKGQEVRVHPFSEGLT